MKLGLIGQTLKHSFSQSYFNKKFKTQQLTNFSYQNFELNTISELPEILNTNPNLVGFNVTFPFKELIIPQLDWIDPYAANVGAVNTVVVQNFNGIKRLLGFNTDVGAFKQSLLHLIYASKPKALILGTGGASKAVARALTELEIPYDFASRNPKKRIPYELINENHISQFKLLINTTPLGTYPNTEEKPILPYQFISKNHYLFDLVYNPIETAFLKEGKKHRAAIKNGYEMLEIQAEASWEIWNHYI